LFRVGPVKSAAAVPLLAQQRRGSIEWAIFIDETRQPPTTIER